MGANETSSGDASCGDPSLFHVDTDECAGIGFSVFNREAFQITGTCISMRLEADIHFYYEHRHKQHRHSELSVMFESN